MSYEKDDLVLVRVRDLDRGDVETVGVVSYQDVMGRYSVWVLLTDRIMFERKTVSTDIYGPVSWALDEHEIVCKVGRYSITPVVVEDDDDDL